MPVIPSIEITMHQLDPPAQPRLRIDQDQSSHPADMGHATRLTQRLVQLGAAYDGNLVVGLLEVLDGLARFEGRE